MECSLCGRFSKFKCGGHLNCKTKYCGAPCAQLAWATHALICGKRDREVAESTSFHVLENIWDLIENDLNIKDEEEQYVFIERLYEHIYENVCHGALWAEDILNRDNFKKQRWDFYFFLKRPTTQEEVFDNLVGVVDLKHEDDDSMHIQRFCSAGGYGREMFLWLDNKYDYPEHWRLDAVSEALIFWLKLGFDFDDDYDGKLKPHLLKLWKKYGNEVPEWLFEDIKDYEKSEMYYDVLWVQQNLDQYKDDLFLLSLWRERRQLDQPTIHKYQKTTPGDFYTFSLNTIIQLVQLGQHPLERTYLKTRLQEWINRYALTPSVTGDVKDMTFYFWREPQSKADLFIFLEAAINVKENQIVSFSSYIYAKEEIVKQLQREFDTLTVESEYPLIGFWSGLKFKFSNMSEKDQIFFMDLIQKHADWEKDSDLKKLIMPYQQPNGTFLMEYKK